jgi:hypothetical protein
VLLDHHLGGVVAASSRPERTGGKIFGRLRGWGKGGTDLFALPPDEGPCQG